MLEVKLTPSAGRGVFAKKDFPLGSKILSEPVLILSKDETFLANATILGSYTYEWGKGSALCLGLGSLLNHSPSPNATFIPNRRRKTIDVFASSDIKAGEEIRINYGYDVKFKAE